jgi:hypothetical protein
MFFSFSNWWFGWICKLIWPYCTLGMCCIIPLLENIDSLVRFAYQHNVFICDLVIVVKSCQGQLYSLYNDGSSQFSSDEFWAFKGLLDYNHDHIHMKWMAKLNDSSEHLAFIMNGDKLWAMHNDTISKIRIVVIKALQQKVSMYAKWFWHAPKFLDRPTWGSN